MDGVHSQEQLDYLQNKLVEGQYIDLLSELPFKWFVIEDYSEDFSYACLVWHHAWQDGMAMMGKNNILKKNR